MNQNQEFFTYRGYPMVRKNHTIYYGRMSDPYVIMVEIKHQTKQEDGMEIADKLNVYQIKTRETDPVKAIVRKSERQNLYEAIDLAHVWLRRAENDAEKKANQTEKSDKSEKTEKK